MLRTAYVHYQEDCIVHAALYGMFSMRLCKQSSGLKDVLILLYLSTAIGLTPGGSTHLHINNTQNITVNNKTARITNKTTQITNLEECWPCPIFANYTLAFDVQLREKQGKPSVSVAEEMCSISSLRDDENKMFETCRRREELTF
jgi:hypothetical protein